jgi:hypothetical protein
MNSRTAELGWRRTFILGALVLSALTLRPQMLLAQGNACALVKASDAASLLSRSPTQTPTPEGMACVWKSADKKRKLAVLTYKNRGVPPEAAYMGARKGAEAGGDAKVSDETGLGDRAFSGEVSFGAVFVVLKKGRLLQLQYWTGGQGTDKDVVALRPVVRKAVAAF